MSLFSSIQLANNSLIAAQLGLQVTGNNIANAHTPGYLRQELVLQPAPTQRVGTLLLGLGVDVVGVIQRVDTFLESRLNDATSELAQGESQEAAYLQLEALVGELSDNDLSTSLTEFFSSIHDVANQPDNLAVRNVAVLKGKGLAHDIQNLEDRVRRAQVDVDKKIEGAAAEANLLLEELAKLNIQITTTEGGDTSASDAVGLRDKQLKAINDLAEIIDIRATRQPDGSTSIFSGSDILAYSGSFNELTVVKSVENNFVTSEVRIAHTDSPPDISSGRLAGLYHARDSILGGFRDGLNEFTGTLVYEFNKVHSSGQGLTGYSEVTSEHVVSDAGEPLDQVDLPFAPINGSFQLEVRNTQTGLQETHDIFVKLNGVAGDTTANDVIAAINAADNVSAELDPSGRLRITSDVPNIEFSFARDTSGVLAALGVNTFFSGTGADNITVNQVLQSDPGKLAASVSGVGRDAANLEVLADFNDRPLTERGGDSLSVIYDRLVGQASQDASLARSVADGLRIFHSTLEGQKLATSGVSIDEEAVTMIKHQRVYQASARFIRTVSDLLETLVNL